MLERQSFALWVISMPDAGAIEVHALPIAALDYCW
jgi:hypothetical protein